MHYSRVREGSNKVHNRVILAVAGAGKTYSLCHKIDSSKKTLILAFTNQNINNIKRELLENKEICCNREIPNNIKVITFDSFLLNFIILPFFSDFLKAYNLENFEVSGVTYMPPPEPFIDGVYNKNYVKDKYINHFVCNNKFYGLLMAKFCCKNKNTTVSIISGFHKFFDEIYIDEFQDFRDYDYKFIGMLAKNFNNVTLVGDFYQHTVSGCSSKFKTPFKKGKVYVSYEDYLNLLIKEKYEIDTTSLNKSRRCSKDICEFIRQKLRIEIQSSELHNGKIIWVDDENINYVLKNDEIVKLVYCDKNKYSFKANTWSYSKGDTYKGTCIILTGDYENIDNQDYIFKKSIISLNTFYVALTRTEGDLYMLKQSIFSKYKKNYIRIS